MLESKIKENYPPEAPVTRAMRFVKSFMSGSMRGGRGIRDSLEMFPVFSYTDNILYIFTVHMYHR
jgi:hypothetical protein